MRKTASFVLLAIGISLVLAPMFVLNANARGCKPPGCLLQAVTNVPAADGTIMVKVDGQPAIIPLQHTWTFANSSVHSILVLNYSFIGASNGMRYTWRQWTYMGLTSPPYQWDKSQNMTTPYMYTNYTTTQNYPFIAEFTVSTPVGCKGNCYLDALTNVPPAEGTVTIRLDNSANYALPHLGFPFANNTVHYLQILNPTFTGASGARYVWKQWSCTCGIASNSSTTLTTPIMLTNYTVSQNGPFMAEFDKQFPMTLTFTDQSSPSNPLSTPSYVILTIGSTSVNVTSFSSVWVSATSWTVGDVFWEGTHGMAVQGQTIDLTGGPATKAIVLKAFSATVKAVDSANNPVANVTITIAFVGNSTTKTFTTNSQGLVQLGYIPLGPFTAHVAYQSKAVGDWSTDASTPGNSVLIVTVPGASGGAASGTLVSAVVLLTIFGLAGFLLLLAIKVRKPPPPPTI